MKLYIWTQDRENYAIDAEGNLGTGDNAYWKFKGGIDYFVPAFEFRDAATTEAFIKSLNLEIHNDAFISEVLGWDVVPDDFQTESEKLQMEYEGKITYPATVVNPHATWRGDPTASHWDGFYSDAK